MAHLDGPGRVKHVGVTPVVRFGELDDARSPRVESLEAAFGAAGVRADVPEDIRVRALAAVERMIDVGRDAKN